MTTTTTTEVKYRTITLTDRPPVRVNESTWPTIASASDHDGQVECQANRRYWLKVRQHADGRTIVYGVYSTNYQHEKDASGGELLSAGSDIVAAIRRVGAGIDCDPRMIDECVADLPAEDLE